MGERHVAKPSRKLWGAVRIWACLYIFTATATIAAFGYRLSLIGQLPAGTYMTEMHVAADLIPGAEAEMWATWCAGLLNFAAWVVAAILVLMWYLRSVRNAHALVTGVRTSPGWVVWLFIIPLVSLWRPYGITSELWRSSHSPDGWKSLPDVPVIRWWWAAVLAGGFASTASTVTARAAETVGQIMVSDGALIASLALHILAGLLFLRIGGRITDLQNRMIEAGREKPPREAGRFAD